ncbi:KIN4 [Auxenochlorella protothecoides x Auxenochlorella symbiontica]
MAGASSPPSKAPAEPHTPDTEASKAECVCVAVHVRPLVESELAEGCEHALTVTPGLPQVGHGAHRFTYDHVFGGDMGRPAWELYGACVAPLVEGLFSGYNATVFAYGQTGSGKTFTMGSSGFGARPEEARGVIPRAMEDLFGHVTQRPAMHCTVRVGFVEIHNEEIRDLLTAAVGGGGAGGGAGIKIREVPGQGVCLAGAAEVEVTSREELAAVLEAGSVLRATAATGMNRRSSRSHAIFTVTVEQRRMEEGEDGAGGPRRCSTASQEDTHGGGRSGDEAEDDAAGEAPQAAASGEDEGGAGSYLCAKLHLVDLAGSERLKRTGATGARLQEGIDINKGLSELGNVISALSEGKPHVPYRNSKLTRMLQDSLGGNSRTLMVACVSPADINLEESMNTLRYASRARNIRNRPVVNRDPVAAQLAHLRQQLGMARAEAARLKQRLAVYESGAGSSHQLDHDLHSMLSRDEALGAAMVDAGRRLRAAELEVDKLQAERDELASEVRAASLAVLRAGEEREALARALATADPTAAATLAAQPVPGPSAALLARVAELEEELASLRRSGGGGAASGAGTPLRSPAPADALLSSGSRLRSRRFSLGAGDAASPAPTAAPREEDDEEARAHAAAHAREVADVERQLGALQLSLEAKERAALALAGHAALRDALSSQLAGLAAERDGLARERAVLLAELERLAHAGEEERARLADDYRRRLAALDRQLAALRQKERRVRELERLKARAEETCARLERDIAGIKTAKAALQRRGEAAAREHLEWQRAREREVATLRKEGRAAAASLHRLQALSAKQQAVLRRKTEEAEAARRRLKEMEERRVRALTPRERPGGTPPLSEGPCPAWWTPPPPASDNAGPDPPCQPHALAPLLRDERARRAWVERELEACCAAGDLQRVLEGELVQRSAAARRLREVEAALAARRNPAWWPASLAAAAGAGPSEAELLAERRALAGRRDAHGRAIAEAQLALYAARRAEEERGAGAADARRWAGVRSAGEARVLLRSVFRAAAAARAAAAEAAAEAVEAGEEVELLRLKLEAAEQDKMEAHRLAAEAEAAPAAAVVGEAAGDGGREFAAVGRPGVAEGTGRGAAGRDVRREEAGAEEGDLGGGRRAAGGGDATLWRAGGVPSPPAPGDPWSGTTASSAQPPHLAGATRPPLDDTDAAAAALLAQLEACIGPGSGVDAACRGGDEGEGACVVERDAAVRRGPAPLRLPRRASSPAMSAAGTPGSHALAGPASPDVPCWEGRCDDDDDDESPSSSSSEEDDDARDRAYTPSQATPAPAARRRRRGRGRSLERGSTRVGGHATGRASLSHEAPLLAWLNAWLAQQGRPTLARLTVPVLRAFLDGTAAGEEGVVIRGRRKSALLAQLQAWLGSRAAGLRPPALPAEAVGGACTPPGSNGTPLGAADQPTPEAGLGPLQRLEPPERGPPPVARAEASPAAEYLQQSEEARARTAALKAAIEEQLRKPTLSQLQAMAASPLRASNGAAPPAPHHSPARSLDGENRGAEAGGQPRPPHGAKRASEGARAGDDAPREGSPAKAPGSAPGTARVFLPTTSPVRRRAWI